MASFTMQAAPRYPAASTVQVYSEESFVNGSGPTSAPVTSAVVASVGTVAFSGLTEETRYVAAQNQSGRWVLTSFRVSLPEPTLHDAHLELDALNIDMAAAQASLAAVQTSVVRVTNEKAYVDDPRWSNNAPDMTGVVPWDNGISGGPGVAGTYGMYAILRGMPAEGGIIAFPPGILTLRQFNIDPSVPVYAPFVRPNLTFEGNGTTLKRQSGYVSPDTFGLASIHGVDHLTIRDLKFDVNHIERFGGIQIYDTLTCRIHHTIAIDSDLNPSWTAFDHYIFVVQNCKHLFYHDNYAEDVESLEFDNCDRISVKDSTNVRAAGTTAFGFFSVSPGYHLIDAEFEGLRVYNHRKLGFCIDHETGGPNNNTLKRIRMADIKVVKDTDSEIGYGVSAPFTYGNAGGGSPTTGNIYEDNHFEDIEVYIDPAVTQPTGVLFRINPAVGLDFTRTVIRDLNVFGTAGAGEWAIDLRQLNDSVIDGVKLRGGSLFGVSLLNMKDSQVRNVSATGATGGIQAVGSRGGNDISELEVFGASTTPFNLVTGAAATDSIRGKRGKVGAIVAAAAMTFSALSDRWVVSGATPITSIVATGQVDRELTLQFSSTAQMTDNGTTLNLNGNFTGGANRMIRLWCDGTNWYEISRSAN